MSQLVVSDKIKYFSEDVINKYFVNEKEKLKFSENFANKQKIKRGDEKIYNLNISKMFYRNFYKRRSKDKKKDTKQRFLKIYH